MTNKILWKIMLKIEKTIRESDGHLFGGYVRDKIIHDYHADCFYEKMKEATSLIEIQNKYNDLDFLPEHKDRCFLPSDIDAFMYTQDMIKMIDILRKKCFKIKTLKTRKANFYFLRDLPQFQELSKLFHTKLIISPYVNSVLSELINGDCYSVSVDIIHTDDKKIKLEKILSDNFDYECNALMITPQNEYRLPLSLGCILTPKEKMNKIENIIENIKNKKAVTMGVFSISSYRIRKMLKKNWSLHYTDFILEKDDNYGGHCLICHDSLQSILIRDKHCDARYHTKCFMNMVSHQTYKNECPMCKNTLIINEKDRKSILTFTYSELINTE